MVKAIDIVLLPPADIIRQAVRINNNLRDDKKKIQLDSASAAPHITLAMGCAEEDNIAKISEILKKISYEFPPIRLESIQPNTNKAWIQFNKNAVIEQLHISLMDRLTAYLDYSVCDFMFFASDKTGISQSTIEYVEKFAREHSFENYIPHMTIDAGNYLIEAPPIDCTAQTIALFHLGNHCTCAQKICSYALSK